MSMISPAEGQSRFKDLLAATAQRTKSQVDLLGSCKRCGGSGHMSYQCFSHLSTGAGGKIEADIDVSSTSSEDSDIGGGGRGYRSDSSASSALSHDRFGRERGEKRKREERRYEGRSRDWDRGKDEVDAVKRDFSRSERKRIEAALDRRDEELSRSHGGDRTREKEKDQKKRHRHGHGREKTKEKRDHHRSSHRRHHKHSHRDHEEKKRHKKGHRRDE